MSAAPNGRPPDRRRLLLAAVSAFTLRGPAARAQAADPRLMTRTEVQLLQEALIWTSSYSALKDGVWGRIASAAMQQWRRGNGLPPSDVLNDGELRLLLTQGARERRAVGWTTVRDDRTGVWIGYPGEIVQPQPVIIANPGVPATPFRGADSTVQLSLFGPGLDLAALRAMLAERAQEPDVSQVDYRLDRPDRQVLSTGMKEGSVRYIRFDRDGDVWRGFVIRVAGSRSDVGRLICAVSADFSANGRPVIEEAWNTPRLSPALTAGMPVAPPRPSASPALILPARPLPVLASPALPAVDRPPPRP